MMQCPSCSSQLVAGEARCGVCQALVNPPTAGASALAPRLVTPQSLDGLLGSGDQGSTPSDLSEILTPSMPPDPTKAADEAWRREVLERVRKRRQARRHALPLFGEGSAADAVSQTVSPEEISPVLEPSVPTMSNTSLEGGPDFDAPLAGSPSPAASNDLLLDLPLRSVPAENDPLLGRGFDAPPQTYAERPRPTLVSSPITPRSLVGDLPLVEPSRPVDTDETPAPVFRTARPRPASMADRAQAALIDFGIWSAMTAVAFYFASRIARTSILGLASGWMGLTLFATVLAAAYIVFFSGLSGATPGKLACGIQVRRSDGTPLGPLPALGRGFLGLLGLVLLGISGWPAFWDKERRTLHDRATDSRVTTV